YARDIVTGQCRSRVARSGGDHVARHERDHGHAARDRRDSRQQGGLIMATSIMHLPPCRPAYWYWNTAPIGQDPVWQREPMPDPVAVYLNRQPKPSFGYEPQEFMARQYK